MPTQIINDNSCIRIINGSVPLIINKSQVKTIDVVKNQTVRIDIGAGALRNIYISYSDVILPAGLPDVDSLRDAIKAMLDGAENDNTSLAANVEQVKTSVDVVKTSVDSVAQSVTNAGTAQTQSLSAVKQSVDALGAQISSVKDSVVGLGTSISNISPLVGLQSIHDEIVTTGQNQVTQLGNMTTALNQIKTLLDSGNDSFSEPVRIDESVPLVVYNGYLTPAGQSALTTDPVWAIQKVTRNGDMFVYEWANGNKQFVNVWDNRNSTAFLAAGQ